MLRSCLDRAKDWIGLNQTDWKRILTDIYLNVEPISLDWVVERCERDGKGNRNIGIYTQALGIDKVRGIVWWGFACQFFRRERTDDQ